MVLSGEAVYEDGVFKPVGRPPLADGQSVHLEVRTAGRPSPEEILALAARAYDGLSAEEIDGVEEIALSRPDFFGAADQRR